MSSDSTRTDARDLAIDSLRRKKAFQAQVVSYVVINVFLWGLWLFTKGDGAWSDSKDATIVSAMRKGKKMEVKGTSWRGTSTTDSYSLSGVKQAMDKIDQQCK